MKKNSAFKLRSGNKPSAAKFFKGVKNTGLAKNMGSKQFQETGQKKKFSETKVGKTGLGKELSKLTGTIFGGGKFKGSKSIGGQVKNMLTKGNKGKTTNPSTKATVNNTQGVLKGDMGGFAQNTLGIGVFKGAGKTRTTNKPKTDFTKVKGSTTYQAPNFKTAFADARKGGKDVFEWKGKSYTTELAKKTKKKNTSSKNQKVQMGSHLTNHIKNFMSGS